MIKITQIPEKKMTIAELTGTALDAINLIADTMPDDLCVSYDAYLLPNKFKAQAVCDDEDEWDPEIGAKLAKERVLAKYYAAKNKALAKFARQINGVQEAIVYTDLLKFYDPAVGVV